MKRDIARKKALPKPPKSCSFSCRGGIGASRGLGASASAAGARAMPWRSQPLSRSRRAQERPAALRQPSEGLGKGLSLIHHDPSGTGTGDEGLAGFWRSGRGFARGLPRAEPTPVPVLRLIGAGGNLQKPNKRSPNALLSVSRQIKGCLQMLNVHASWAWRCESAQEHVEV